MRDPTGRWEALGKPIIHHALHLKLDSGSVSLPAGGNLKMAMGDIRRTIFPLYHDFSFSILISIFTIFQQSSHYYSPQSLLINHCLFR